MEQDLQYTNRRCDNLTKDDNVLRLNSTKQRTKLQSITANLQLAMPKKHTTMSSQRNNMPNSSPSVVKLFDFLKHTIS
jgi:hypothetical protein